MPPDADKTPRSDREGDHGSSRVNLGGGAWIARDLLRFTFSRAGGPGGQAVNKLSTRAILRIAIRDIGGLDEAARDRLRHLAGQRLTQGDEIVIQSQTFRSQLDNKHEAMDRLAELVEKSARKPTVRKRKKISKALIRKRLESKRTNAKRKAQRRWKSDGD